jgi:hypothetical protein
MHLAHGGDRSRVLSEGAEAFVDGLLDGPADRFGDIGVELYGHGSLRKPVEVGRGLRRTIGFSTASRAIFGYGLMVMGFFVKSV